MCLRWICVVCMRGSLDTWSQMWTWENKAVLILLYEAIILILYHQSHVHLLKWNVLHNNDIDLVVSVCFRRCGWCCSRRSLSIWSLRRGKCTAYGSLWRRPSITWAKPLCESTRTHTHTHTPQIKPIWLIWHIWCWFDHRLYKTAQQHANTP